MKKGARKKMKKNKSIATLILLVVSMVLLAYTAVAGWGAGHTGSARNINLGLDLEGGVSITYQVVGETPTQEDMADTIYRLQLRVQDFSNESSVFQEGDDRINIEIPGVTDANLILSELGRPGSLLFIRQTDAEGNRNFTMNADGTWVLTKSVEELQEDGDVILTGTDVSSAQAVSSNDNLGNAQFGVSLRFTAEGTETFAQATQTAFNNNEAIAIYFDGELVSVPTVNQPILNGEAQITGNFSFDEAERLASTIRIGGLNVELQELRSNVVGAQLGEEAVRTSVLAGIVGIIILIALMIFIFLVPGVAASIALLIYTALTLILINGFDITITLPGIAGIILGIGMAVDANIIIFARLKEELAEGKSVRLAIKNSFQKAMSAILDGQITTLLVAIILWLRGSGTVRSFAQTLTLSIVVSMFTALLITRLIIFAFYGVGIRNEKFWARHFKKRFEFDFIKHKAKYFIISSAIVLAGFVVMGINGARGAGVLNFGLEFTGGSSTHVSFGQAFSLSEVDGDIVPEIADIIGTPHIQFQMVTGTNDIIFRTPALSLQDREALANMFESNYGVDPNTITTENITGTISNEMRSDAIWAIIIAGILMLIYIWFRFKDMRFATSAVIALFNDILFVLTFYVFTRISVGNTFIAVMLTIFGYSINSTIIIFDRIREEMKSKAKSTDLREVVNHCISVTLTRTIYTTLTSFITIAALYILGVNAIRDFALPLMFGIIVSVYTSVCLAPSLWYVMKVRQAKKAQKA